MLRYIRIIMGMVVFLLYVYLVRGNLDSSLYSGMVPLGLVAIEIVEKTGHYISYRRRAGKILRRFEHKSIFSSRIMSILLSILALWIMIIAINGDVVYIGGIGLFALSLINVHIAFTRGKACENGVYVKGYYAEHEDIYIDINIDKDVELSLDVLPITYYKVVVSEKSRDMVDFLEKKNLDRKKPI